jgi:hypothetical protein
VPKTRNVLNHLYVETAVGRRKCHTNSKHSIEPGDTHLAQETATGRHNICLACAGKVLDVAEQELADLRSELGV